MLLLAEAIDTSWTGPTSLTVAGILVAVLGWVFGKHIPAKDAMIEKKDAQLEKVLALHSSERELDRKARHDVANMFQLAIAESNKSYAGTIKEIEDEHRKDAEADRNAFMERNSAFSAAITQAISMQTEALRVEIRAAMVGQCKWFEHMQNHNAKDNS